MVSSPTVEQILKQLNRFSLNEVPSYVLYGSHSAVELFFQSPEHLMDSDNFDYHVVKLALSVRRPDFLEEVVPIETYTLIDEHTFHQLHQNLCSKADKFILAPLRKKK